MPRDAPGEAQLAVRAGADADIVAEFPIVEVVAAAMPRPRESRGLVMPIARRAEHLLRCQLHVGALVMLRQLRRLAPEHGVGLDRQLIGRDVRRAQAHGLLDVGPRHRKRLARQPVHQVEIHVVEALERHSDGAPGFVRAVDAAESREHAIVKALHADRDAVHARLPEAGEARRFDRARIRFERDFRARLERQARAHAGKQRLDRSGREQARRAATDEYADDASSPHGRKKIFKVIDQLPNVLALGELTAALVRVEVAVRAFAHAPGDVNIERERRQELHAAIISIAILLHVRENFFIVAGVPLLAAALAPGVAGRAHSGLAGEGLDAQSRVIAKRRQARGPARVPRLGERILEKSGVRLSGLADAELRLRYELDIQRREQRPDLPQLAGIAARQDEPHRGAFLRSAALISAIALSMSSSDMRRKSRSVAVKSCTSVAGSRCGTVCAASAAATSSSPQASATTERLSHSSPALISASAMRSGIASPTGLAMKPSSSWRWVSGPQKPSEQSSSTSSFASRALAPAGRGVW